MTQITVAKKRNLSTSVAMLTASMKEKKTKKKRKEFVLEKKGAFFLTGAEENSHICHQLSLFSLHLTGSMYFSWMVAYSWSVSCGVEPRNAWMTAVRLKAFLCMARMRSDWPISHSMGVPWPLFRLIFLEMVT